ncbi:hypothetical protein [Longispora urticae]
MGDVEAVRDMIAALSRVDERQGGGHARRVVVQYLTDDVAAYLDGNFASEAVRRAMFSAAAELTYLAGWKSFDSNLHRLAQMYYHRALRLADEADDRGLAGFILRALAHQAADLGHGAECVRQADVALDWSRKHRTPAAAALFTVVRARGLAVDRQPVQARATLRHAEGLLARVDVDEEPIWLRRMGFGEASLANQTAQTLRDLGDLGEAERQFQRSTAVRNGGAHRRIHALTLANLAATQWAAGKLGDACATWNDALDHMDGLRSAGRERP